MILPATSHIGISGESAVLVPMVSAFLDDVPPATPDLFFRTDELRDHLWSILQREPFETREAT